MIKHKHTFEYEIYESDVDDVPCQKISCILDGDITLDAILNSFQTYLIGAGFFLNGELKIVPEDTIKIIKQ